MGVKIVTTESGKKFRVTTETPTETKKTGVSPLSVLERAKFAFGEERGRERFLREKFPEAITLTLQ